MRYRSGGKQFRIKNMQVKDLPGIADFLSISPYELGKIGGEMARRMMETAEGYLSQQVAAQVQKSFRETVSEGFNEGGLEQ